MRARGLLMHSGSALETGLRVALLEDGRVALGQLLQDCADLVDAAYKRVLRKFLQPALKQASASEIVGLGILADELGFRR